jgi:hypothetical protein
MTFGTGLTVIVKICGKPKHPEAEAVTVMEAVLGKLPVLTAVKAGIFPVPLAANPIDGSLFIQLKVAAFTALLNVIVFVDAPWHNTWFAGCITLGVGLTVIVNVCGKPGQPAAEGVTDIVAV